MPISLDARGVPLSPADAAVLAAFEEALVAFRTYRGDPVAALDRVIALDPRWPAAPAAKALVLLTLFERRFVRDARAVLDAAAGLFDRATDRCCRAGRRSCPGARSCWACTPSAWRSATSTPRRSRPAFARSPWRPKIAGPCTP